MPGAPESLKGLSVLSLRHPDCHTGFQGEPKHLFAGLLKPELQVINPRPQEQTVRIRQWGLVHTWFPLASLEKYVLNFICDGSRRSYDSQSQSEVGLYILKDKSQG